MKMVNPFGKTVGSDASINPRACICSLDAKYTVMSYTGGTSCSTCGCGCAHGDANMTANSNTAYNSTRA